MVHIATAILEQKNPKLITEMISKIDRFAIYKRTVEQYKGLKAYQLPDGKPNIRKIKKEAVDKLIAEVIVNDNENLEQNPKLREEINQSWVRKIWNDIVDWFKGEYKKTNIDVFKEAASEIMSGDFGTVEEITTGDVFYQATEPTDAQKVVQAKLADTDNIVRKVEAPENVDPALS